MFKTTVAAAPYVVEDVTPPDPSAPFFTLTPKLLEGLNYYNFIKPIDITAATVSGEKVYFVADEGGVTKGKITYISPSKNFEIIENINKPTKIGTAFDEFLLVLDTEGDPLSPNFGKSILLIYAFREIVSNPDTNAMTIRYLNKITLASSNVKDFCINEGSRLLYFIEDGNPQIKYFSLQDSNEIRGGVELSQPTLGQFAVAGITGNERPRALTYGNDNVYVLFSNSICYISTTAANHPLTQTRLRATLDQPVDIAYVNQVIYLSDNYGIKYFYEGDIGSFPKVVTPMAIISGQLIQPYGLFADGNALLITDTSDGGRCVQRFLINSDRSLRYDGVMLGSLGYNEGRLYEPHGVTSKNDITYIADTKNRRIQAWSGDSIIAIFSPPQITMPVAVAVGFNADSTILYAVDDFNKVLEISENGTVTVYTTGDGAPFSNIGDIATGIDGTVYVTDAGRNKVYSKKLSETAFSVFIDDIPTPLSISVSERTSNLYITQNSAGDTISVYDVHGTELTDLKISLPNTTIMDIALDYNDTVFALVKEGGEKLLKRFAIDGANDRYLLTDLINDGKYSLEDVLSIYLNEVTGELVIADTLNNVVFFIPKEQTGAVIISELPSNEPPPVPILPTNMPLLPAYPIGICTVVSFPSTVLYPIDLSYEFSHPYYPTDFAHRNIEYLPEQTRLVVLGSSESGLFYYVLYKGKAAFVLKSGVRLEGETPPPYIDGAILHTEATVFKYPVLTKNNSENYDFKITTLSKGERITLVSTVSNYQENGIFWYEVLYTTEAGVSKGYVQRYQITPDLNRDDKTQIFGKIKAEINVGLVGVYDKKDENEQPFTMLRDTTRIRILNDSLDGWVFIEGTDNTGNLFNGYVMREYVIYDGLTTAQRVGIIIFILAVIAGIITLKYRKPYREKTSSEGQIRL
jgi:hypothetical protein